MSFSQVERPPTFDVKIVGGKKIIIWNQNSNKKKAPQKPEDLPQPSQISPSPSKPTTESTTVTATVTATDTEEERKKIAEKNDRTGIERVTEGQKTSTNSELKLNNGGNEDRNKRESGDIAVKSKININDKESDANLPQIDSGENSPMKRRSASPPSLSSSFKILPPIRKELEVEFSVSNFFVEINIY